LSAVREGINDPSLFEDSTKVSWDVSAPHVGNQTLIDESSIYLNLSRTDRIHKAGGFAGSVVLRQTEDMGYAIEELLGRPHDRTRKPLPSFRWGRGIPAETIVVESSTEAATGTIAVHGINTVFLMTGFTEAMFDRENTTATKYWAKALDQSLRYSFRQAAAKKWLNNEDHVSRPDRYLAVCALTMLPGLVAEHSQTSTDVVHLI